MNKILRDAKLSGDDLDSAVGGAKGMPEPYVPFEPYIARVREIAQLK